MKRSAIRAEVDAALAKLGFRKSQYRWDRADCHIIIGNEFVTVRFPAGMSQKALQFEIGKITGWCEMLAHFNRLKHEVAHRAAINGRAKGEARAQ